MEQGSTSWSTSGCNDYGNYTLQPKHKVFLSHSGTQKGFVEQLCVDLERCDRHPFFDKRRDSLPIGKEFPRLIFEAIEQCEVGVVILSEEFFTSKWPMLELVAMANVKKKKSSFTIMPILLGLTFSQCRDVTNHKRWLSLWHIWAESDSRIDVKDWENALQLFGPTNALKYNLELGEVAFRVEIVEAICKLVPPRTRFEDSHIKGRSRLCKVIHERIQHSKVSSLYGIRIVGLYGVGGIGKTTICKSMCNDVSEDCCSKVAHMELGSQSEEELLKDVLRRLTNINLEYLGARSIDEYHYHLMRDMMNIKVFLAIDNVSSATSKQAVTLLRANYGVGSVLLVTARSLNELTSLGIDVSECMEMPELEMEEARSLFLYHVACVLPIYWSDKDDHKLISSCIQRCHFKKGDGISSHYHPLALQTLGEQLRYIGYVPERWRSLLHEIDYLNPFGEHQHPVFSILRKSFDALNFEDQLLFMDLALFSPYDGGSRSLKWNVFEWLGMVHGISMESVMRKLENLKRNSLLENLGDGFGKIGMHDLWREFARLETKAKEDNALEQANVINGGRWVNLKRMFFDRDEGSMKVKDVNFDCFPIVTVLKLSTSLASILELDLRGLKHLKSLEVEDFVEYESMRSPTLISLIGLSSLSNLGFLWWLSIPLESSCIDEIIHLTNLRVLELNKCRWIPDLSHLILLEVACFHSCYSVLNNLGLSRKHTKLQFLNLSYCYILKSCLGVGELVALQELHLSGCSELIEVPNLRKLKRLEKLHVEQCSLLQALPGLDDLVNLVELHLSGCSELIEVPNLRKLKRLQKLHVERCSLLQALPGLDDLVNLVELHANSCVNLVELPDMCNLQNLKILDLSYCKCIKVLQGLHVLNCLEYLKMLGCKNLMQLLDMRKLTNLQTLELDQKSIVGLSNLILLRHLYVGIDELHNGLDLHKLTKLKMLNIMSWQGQGFSSLAELVSLESITIKNCKGVNILPDLVKLSRLHDLKFESCDFEDLSGLINLTILMELEIMDCAKLGALPNLQELVELRKLKVNDCTQLRDVHGIFGLQSLTSMSMIGNPWLYEILKSDLQCLTGLRSLDLSDCGFTDLHGLIECSQIRFLICKRCPIQELPDLANFPELFSLIVRDCVNLTKLTCTGPISSELWKLDVYGCKRLQALPDLTNALEFEWLDVANSGVVLSPQFIQDMKARWPDICLVTRDPPSQLPLRRNSCTIWCHILRMITSLHLGCFGTCFS